jgi:hypothetical protein
MVFTVLKDNGYDGLELLGEYTEKELSVLTSKGFYCEKWAQFLIYDRSELTIIEGRELNR